MGFWGNGLGRSIVVREVTCDDNFVRGIGPHERMWRTIAFEVDRMCREGADEGEYRILKTINATRLAV